MSEIHGHNQNDHDQNQVESSSIQPRPILMFLIILGVATAFVFAIVKGLDWGLKKIDEQSQGQAATQVETQGRKLPPEPLLQGAPGKGSTATSDVPTELPLEEMERVRKETAEKTGSYGWVDKPTGVARIPIDRAKDIIAEKGLTALSAATITEEVGKAEAIRKQVLNADSSGGRAIRIQQTVQQPVLQPAPQPVQQAASQTAPQPAQPQGQHEKH